MSNEQTPAAAPVSPDQSIRKMTGTTFFLILVYAAVLWLKPRIPEIMIQDLGMDNISEHIGCILSLSPMAQFLLSASERIVIAAAVADAILHNRVFFGLLASFGVYLGMLAAFLLFSVVNVSEAVYCAIVIGLAVLGMFLCFKQFSASNQGEAFKIFTFIPALVKSLSAKGGPVIDRAAAAVFEVLIWLGFTADVIELVVYLIIHRQAFLG